MSQPKLFFRATLKQVSILAAVAILGTITILSAFLLVSDSASNSYATSVNSEVTAEIDGTHYVTLSAPDVTFSITPTDSAQLSKQNVNVNVETNAPGGADLYLTMSGNTNALHLNGDTTSTAPAIEATTSSVPANGLTANTWGYSTDDQTYSAVPTSDSDPALLAAVDGSSVGSNAGGVITASIPVYYAANVDTSIPSGSYANRMTYSAVVDGGIITSATLTKIEIDGAEVENMQPEVENTLLITTNLMTNTYGTPRVYYEATSPAGYQECGDVVVSRNESGYMTITCRVTPTQAATGVTLHIVPKGSADDRFCTDNTYQPDTSDCEAGEWKWGSFVINGLTIEEPKLISWSDLEYMQDMTSRTCNTTPIGSTKQLIDLRDNKKYWVAKLTDGNCWMTQNLDLDLSVRTALTPSDTDVFSSWTPSANTATNISGFERSDTGMSYDPGSVYYEDTSGRDSHYHVGNYYQWSAATAGYAGTSQSTQSICPRGWTLPSGTQFQTLVDSGLSGSNFMNSPYYFVRGGIVLYSLINNTSSWDSRGEYGYYWSSTPLENFTNNAERLVFSSSGAVVNYSSCRAGHSVRCIVK